MAPAYGIFLQANTSFPAVSLCDWNAMHTSPPLHRFALVRSIILAACAASLFACGGQGTPAASTVPAATLKPVLLATMETDNTAYTVTILAPSSGWAFAGALNNRGQIVGATDPQNTPFTYRAAMWDGSKVTDWTTFGDAPSYAASINDGGQIAGYSNQHPMLWRGSTAQQLGTLGGSYGNAIGINNAGQAVGMSATADNMYGHATLWDGDRVIDLGTLGGRLSVAWALNDSGDIVGYSTVTPDDYTSHPTLWKNGTVRDLGTLGGSMGSAASVNNKGQAVGWSYTAGDAAMRATLWENGTARDLGTLGGDTSNANAINNAGDIVGESANPQNEGRATLWHGGRIIDLNTVLAPNSPAGVLTNAIAINDSGQILVGRSGPNGEERLVLLTPNHRDSGAQ